MSSIPLGTDDKRLLELIKNVKDEDVVSVVSGTTNTGSEAHDLLSNGGSLACFRNKHDSFTLSEAFEHYAEGLSIREKVELVQIFEKKDRNALQTAAVTALVAKCVDNFVNSPDNGTPWDPSYQVKIHNDIASFNEERIDDEGATKYDLADIRRVMMVKTPFTVIYNITTMMVSLGMHSDYCALVQKHFDLLFTEYQCVDKGETAYTAKTSYICVMLLYIVMLNGSPTGSIDVVGNMVVCRVADKKAFDMDLHELGIEQALLGFVDCAAFEVIESKLVLVTRPERIFNEIRLMINVARDLSKQPQIWKAKLNRLAYIARDYPQVVNVILGYSLQMRDIISDIDHCRGFTYKDDINPRVVNLWNGDVHGIIRNLYPIGDYALDHLSVLGSFNRGVVQHCFRRGRNVLWHKESEFITAVGQLLESKLREVDIMSIEWNGDSGWT